MRELFKVEWLGKADDKSPLIHGTFYVNTNDLSRSLRFMSHKIVKEMDLFGKPRVSKVELLATEDRYPDYPKFIIDD